MLDLDGIEQVSNATGRYKLAKTFLRDCPCTASIRPTDKDALHCVSCRLSGRAASPCRYQSIKPIALKPSRISAGNVHAKLEPACRWLSMLIAGAQQPFAMSGACIVEVDLPWIWLVVGEFVLNEPPLLFGEQPSG